MKIPLLVSPGMAVLGAVMLGAVPLTAMSDGTETLGPPVGVDIAPGTAILAGGVGLSQGKGQPGATGDISIDVPAGASIEQVLVYWEGNEKGDGTTPPGVAAQDTISVGGNAVTGDFIGGFLTPGTTQFLVYRADITDLDLVQAGANTISISGLDFNNANNGAGIVVIVDDGVQSASLDIRDGSDRAFAPANPPEDTTVPQTFQFAASNQNREATLILFVADVEGVQSGDPGRVERGTTVEITVGGTTTSLVNVLKSVDGEEWDTLIQPVTIPAGETEVTVQVLSTSPPNNASLTWLYASLTVPLPETGNAALGDRVWEDLNNNGRQNCSDDNQNGILGDAGDSGAECAAGVPGVPVNLFQPDSNGDCTISLGLQQVTDADGFYLFENLVPGDYCVQFDISPLPDDFCTTDGFDLGSPLFTAPNVGTNDRRDSDADPDNGLTEALTLAAGETDRSLDAGIICPAKIGDRVWEDLNEDGLQDDNEEGVEDVKVELFECGPDGIAGTNDDVFTGETRQTDAVDGMYMFGGEPGVFDLPPGDYYVKFTKPDGTEFTQPNVNGDANNSDCEAPDGITSCTTLGPRGINLDRDCGLIPPPPQSCNLLLDKQCRVEPKPSADFEKCEGRLQEFTVVWAGSGGINVSGVKNSSGGNTVNPGDAVTFFGPFSDNDVVVNITGSESGQSVFHTSCSDENFNSPDDCGKAAGNGKKDKEGFLDLWTLEGFVDKEGTVLNCGSNNDGPFAQECTFTPGPLPSCDTTGKPDTLTWRYDGGTEGDGNCADSTFPDAVNAKGKSHKDFECSGSVDTSLPATVTPDKGGSLLVDPGEEFTLSRKASKKIALSTNGDEQKLEFHTSCSQPIQVGLTGGALTLVAMDGARGGSEVTYQYEVTNNGDPLTGVTVVDDLLGPIAGPFDLGNGESETFTKSALIRGTTVNVGTASGELAGGEKCIATDKVIIEPKPPEPPTGPTECTTKISATSLRYTGPDITGATVVFEPKDKDANTVTYSNVDLVSGVTILSLPEENGFTIDGRPKDLGSKLTIKINGETNEVHHTSCSTPYIAGQPAPLDGNSPGKPDKGDPSPNWFVENFLQK